MEQMGQGFEVSTSPIKYGMQYNTSDMTHTNSAKTTSLALAGVMLYIPKRPLSLLYLETQLQEELPCMLRSFKPWFQKS